MSDSEVDLAAAPDVTLFHIAETADVVPGDRAYRAPSLDTEGFIHLSAGHQVMATTERHYKGRSGLLLLTIDVQALDRDALRWETAPHGEDFPHLYGAIPAAAVTTTHPWPPGAGI